MKNTNTDIRFKGFKKEKREAYERLLAAGHTWLEAEELYEFDTEHCDSDKAAAAYLAEYTELSDRQVEEAFAKVPTNKAESAAESRERTKTLKEGMEGRMDRLEEEIAKAGWFPGGLVERTSTTLMYKDAETGLGVSFKLSKHKEQKVVTTEMRKKKRNTTDGPVEVDWTPVDLRAMKLHELVKSCGDVFEAPSCAGTSVGFAIRDEKYPFGSVKMTHHKS